MQFKNFNHLPTKRSPRICWNVKFLKSIKCYYIQDPFITFLDNKTILNGQQNIKHNLKKSKKLLTEQISNKIPDPNQPFYAMCDASNFGICATLLQSHNGTNKKNLNSANSRLFTQAELRHSALMRECTAIIYTLTEYEFLILGSKHQQFYSQIISLSFFILHKKSNPNHRVYKFQLIIMKFPNSHITRTAGKILYYLTLLVGIHH